MDIAQERLKRTALLLDSERMERLRNAHVLLFGLGGVGSYAAEALARLGIGHLTIVDNDTVAPSNLNRQLPALESTVGQQKTDVVAARLRDAAPGMKITTVNAFYLPENPVEIPADCTVVLDAIDSVADAPVIRPDSAISRLSRIAKVSPASVPVSSTSASLRPSTMLPT